jgi:hypothetical protein
MLASTTAYLLLGSTVLAAPEPALNARIDAAVAAEWQRDALAPEQTADDAAFLRRAWLDLAGRVPPADQARAFLDDRLLGKRVRLVDRLLASPEFADHWGSAWAQRLTGGRRPVPQDKYNGRVLHEYLRDALATGKSYRDVAVELITGEGVSDASGPANFLLRYEAKPTDLAGAVSKQFLGVTLQCAQCHNHPFAKWKKDDFWGVAAFFGRVRMTEYSNDETGEAFTTLVEVRRGDLQVPDPDAKPGEDGKVPRKTVPLRLPSGETPKIPGKRRPALAAWVTADGNPYFARHAVNWVWAELFGAGLVKNLDKVDDDLGPHADLLNLLAADFATGGYDVKRLVRGIAISRTYQVGAAAAAGPDDEKTADRERRRLEHYASFPTRPLSVDQLYRCIVQATGHPAAAPPEPPADGTETEPDDADHPVDALTERALTVQRTLALMNGPYVHEAVQAGAQAAVKVHGEQPGPAHVEALFLATLSRRPTAAEAAAMLKLAQSGEGTQGLEDVLWALVNSAEFNTNH